MTKALKNFLLALILVTSLGCKEDKTVISEVTTDDTVTTYYLIRHAEKDRSNLDDTDPELNQDGLGRSIKWAEVFSSIPLDAVYSTDFERTSMTAEPTAIQQDLIITYFNPSEINIENFKADNHGKNVLIVGHSNSTPEMVNSILGEDKYDSLDDYDNGSLFIIRSIDSNATDIHLNLNLN